MPLSSFNQPYATATPLLLWMLAGLRVGGPQPLPASTMNCEGAVTMLQHYEWLKPASARNADGPKQVLSAPTLRLRHLAFGQVKPRTIGQLFGERHVRKGKVDANRPGLRFR